MHSNALTVLSQPAAQGAFPAPMAIPGTVLLVSCMSSTMHLALAGKRYS